MSMPKIRSGFWVERKRSILTDEKQNRYIQIVDRPYADRIFSFKEVRSNGMEHIFREDSIRLIGSVRRLVRQEIDLSTYLKGVPEENLEMDVDNCKGVSNGFLSELI